jgi:proline dehydrogenase
VQVLRQTLLAVSRSERVRDLVTSVPVSSAMVARYVAGGTEQDALAAARQLVDDGLAVSLDHLGEDTDDEARASASAAAYVQLLRSLSEQGLTPGAEVSIKLSAVGQALRGSGGRSGERLALEHARSVCRAARNAGTTVTLDMEDHRTTDSTLRVLRDLRKDFPETGAVLQAYLRRTADDCRDLAGEGSRVRLCKGAYREPASVAYQDRLEVDRSYVRCLRVLMEGDGYPMVATHDPRLIAIAAKLAERAGRAPGSWEYQMLYGVRPEEQQRLRALGHTVRVYVPYGAEWYGYLVRRLAERPANLAFFLRSLVSRS